MADRVRAEGENAARFAHVREAFEQSFEGGEVGAALAVTVDGVQVLTPAQIERANTEQSNGCDEVLAPLHTRFGLGFFLTQPMIRFGPNPRSFGHPGAGGSIAFADPDARLGIAYVMNQMQIGLPGDARGFRLITEVYEALK